MSDHARVSPTILVTGGNGQLGFELRRSLLPLGRVVAPSRAVLDISDACALRDAVRQLHPDVIVNAAAYTAVDKAEADADAAFAVNARAPGILADEACSLNCLLIHYSTDYVFAGNGDQPLTETEPTDPLSVYGKSKLEGEQAVATSAARAIMFRTSWVAGLHGSNFVKTMLRLGLERDTLRVVADQFGAPTTASLIADVTARIIDRYWLGDNRETMPYGIYHLAASGETTWHGYAMEVLKYAASRGIRFRLDPATIEPITALAYGLAAPRPANSRLNTSKIRQTFGICLPHWIAGIHYLIDQILAGRLVGCADNASFPEN